MPFEKVKLLAAAFSAVISLPLGYTNTLTSPKSGEKGATGSSSAHFSDPKNTIKKGMKKTLLFREKMSWTRVLKKGGKPP